MLFNIFLFTNCKIEIKKSPKSSELVTGIMVHSGLVILFMHFQLTRTKPVHKQFIYAFGLYSERFNQTIQLNFSSKFSFSLSSHHTTIIVYHHHHTDSASSSWSLYHFRSPSRPVLTDLRILGGFLDWSSISLTFLFQSSRKKNPQFEELRARKGLWSLKNCW